MKITVKVHNVRVIRDGEDQGPHCQAIGRMFSDQVLIHGRILAGHAPSVRAEAMKEVVDWLGSHRPGWDVECWEVE